MGTAAGRRAVSQPTLRILGIMLGTGRVEGRIAAAWRALWSQQEWLLSRPLTLKLRCKRWEPRVAPVLAFGSLSWTRSDQIVQRMSTETLYGEVAPPPPDTNERTLGGKFSNGFGQNAWSARFLALALRVGGAVYLSRRA